MKSLRYSLIFLFFTSCFQNFDDEIEYISTRTFPKITAKEQQFIDSLQNIGFYDIELDLPAIDDYKDGWKDYQFHLKSDIVVTNKNIDSLILLKYNLVKHLYMDVISDSMIKSINMIGFNMRFDHYTQKDKKLLSLQLDNLFHTDSLAKWTGVYRPRGVRSSIPIK